MIFTIQRDQEISNLRGREVALKMFMQIVGSDENGRNTLLTNIGWNK